MAYCNCQFSSLVHGHCFPFMTSNHDKDKGHHDKDKDVIITVCNHDKGKDKDKELRTGPILKFPL